MYSLTMAQAPPLPAVVPADPTKRFFVSMLTRDIALEDALLDLLDNCIDGILRTSKPKKSLDRPYGGYWAHLTITAQRFVIEDNCGGIPLTIATTSAFMMGRPTTARSENLPTVGVYGIGMKRAIFKLGQHCVVSSFASDASFEVHIEKSWFTDEKNWKLPIRAPSVTLAERGTRIEVTDLNPDVRTKFSSEDVFIDRFKRTVAQQYNRIIQKGFAVSVNRHLIKATVPRFLSVADLSKEGIAPYLFEGKIGEVEVEIIVGFYRPTPGENEVEQESEAPHSSDEAGWTLICNDRIVLDHDKSILTGWGDATVPRYHNQFIGIAGVVHFRCKDPAKLPLTTTKRGIDASSPVYLQTKNKMRDGLKRFTSMTNRFKKQPEEKDQLFKATKAYTLEEFEKVRLTAKFTADRAVAHARVFIPKIPESKQVKQKTIRFTKTELQIRKVSRKIFDDPAMDANKVGEACFDRILHE
jgi:Histidine kinase-, DNA gyrase B-, and HSP90-like ATPase